MEPIKGQIDVVGLGNHEASTIRHHSFDPVSALCDRLGVAGAYGGYAGYWRGQWRREVRSTGSFLVRYHHGSGGGAPVTKGVIDLSRMGSWASDADLIWIGHKHNQLVVPMARERVRNSGRVAHDTVYAVMSGGYLDPLAENTAPSYAEQFGLGPQPKGGAFVALEISQDTMQVKVKGVEFGV